MKCNCKDEIKTGQTSVMCCNVCGLPDEEFWEIPSDKNWSYREECERLAGLVKFWQEKYYKLNPPHQNPKIDNL